MTTKELREAWDYYNSKGRVREKSIEIWEAYLKNNPNTPFRAEIYYRMAAFFTHRRNPKLGENYSSEKAEYYYQKAIDLYADSFSILSCNARLSLCNFPSHRNDIEYRKRCYEWMKYIEMDSKPDDVWAVNEIAKYFTSRKVEKSFEERKIWLNSLKEDFFETYLEQMRLNTMQFASESDLLNLSKSYPGTKLVKMANERLWGSGIQGFSIKNTAVSNKWTQTLPDNQKLKLMALFRPKDNPIVFWDPNGNVIKGPELAKYNIENASNNDLAYVLQRPRGIYKDGYENPAPDGNYYHTGGWKTFQLESNEPLVIRYTNANSHGKWEQIGTIRKGQTVIKDNNYYKLEEIHGFTGANAQVLPKMFYSSDPEFMIRLIAVTKNGKQHQLGIGGPHTQRDQWVVYYSGVQGIEPGQVDHFIIQKQKTHWIFFGGFAKEPNGKVDLLFTPPPFKTVDDIASDYKDWKTIGSVKANTAVELGYYKGYRYTIDQPDYENNNGIYRINIDVIHTLDPAKYQVRMVGIKKNGNIVKVGASGTGDSKLSNITYKFNHAPIEFYKEFQLQVHPNGK